MAHVLRNTDTIAGSKRDAKPQRRDQDLHCDLPAGVFGLDLTQDHIDIKDKIRDQVLGLIQPDGQQPFIYQSGAQSQARTYWSQYNLATSGVLVKIEVHKIFVLE